MGIELQIIAACDLNGSIGKDGGIPWYIPEDFKYFKDLTTAVSKVGKMNAVVMGRKTWESLPSKPLPGRFNIVVSRTLQYIPGAHVCKHLNDAIDYIAKYKSVIETAFVIGGSSLFKSAMFNASASTVHLTIVQQTFDDCDTKFPLKILTDFWEEDESKYSGVIESRNNSIPFSFHTYHKK